MNRVAFLVDGFNLYHSLEEASAARGNVTTKWLDLRSFCRSYLQLIGADAVLADIFYFSALASYREARDPDVTRRHLNYIECLRATGVQVRLGRFKKRFRSCPHCSKEILSHEEKETDVAIGVKLAELCWRDLCDSAALITGDSDLVPAITSVKAHFPKKAVISISPFQRIGFELERLCDKSFRAKSRSYLPHQFPDPFELPSGEKVAKPPTW